VGEAGGQLSLPLGFELIIEASTWHMAVMATTACSHTFGCLTGGISQRLSTSGGLYAGAYLSSFACFSWIL
jgi:hypothetical protein